jgi:hypothetical protein
MTELTDVELERGLSELERDLGPTLRAIYRNDTMRAGFAAQVRATTRGNGYAATRSRPALRILHVHGWSALAATLVGVLVVAGVVLTNQARPVSAADVLDQLQVEAVGAWGEAIGQCPGPGAATLLAARWSSGRAGQVADRSRRAAPPRCQSASPKRWVSAAIVCGRR